MNASAFRHLYGYHFAENRKLWDDYIMLLSAEQFRQAADYSQGSVRDQIVHLMSVDNVWFSELRGVEPAKPLPPANVDDRQLVRAHWDSVEQTMRAYLAELRDEQLFTTPIKEPDEDKELIVWQVLLHVVNHGTDHRAQLLRLLNDLGVKTTSQDYIFYVYDHPIYTSEEPKMKKSELLQWLHNEYRQWETLLDQIGLERMDQPGVNGQWSFKDLIAHLTGWQPRLIGRIQAAQRGEPEPPPPWPAHLQTEDEINAWIYESNRGRSVREVLDESRRVFQQLLAVIEGLPEDVRIDQMHQQGRVYHLVWLGDQRFPAGEFFDHFHDDHEPDVRAWLARLENQ